MTCHRLKVSPYRIFVKTVIMLTVAKLGWPGAIENSWSSATFVFINFVLVVVVVVVAVVGAGVGLATVVAGGGGEVK